MPTLVLSKRWENRGAMIALWLGWYNYCRIHSTLKTTASDQARAGR
jgi:transposase InsO family protein